jgi:hypothetical protein
MSFSDIRSSARFTLWRRALWALIGIPALLLGFVTMHALVPESAISPDLHTIAQVLAAPDASADAGAAPSDRTSCDQSCETLHDIIAVACVVGLVLGLFFLLPLVKPRWGALARRVSRGPLLAPSQLLQPQISLDLLSISRT